MGAARNGLTLAMVVAVSATLAACAPSRDDTTPMPVPTVTTSASPSAKPTSEPNPDPTMLPGGTALANHAYFDFVNRRLLAVNANPSDEAIVKNLVDAGFPKADLEITSDKTYPLGLVADSIEFAVRTSDGCLLGHFKAGDYHSIVGPPVNGDRCLIGKTEPLP